MKRVETVYWPGGCERAVTLSFDDGRTEDYRLVEMFNKYGLKASFHLCIPELLQKLIGDATLVDAADYAALYKGHEISCHMAHHPFPAWMPDEAIRAEITENRLYLEKLCGYPVRGMSYPYGSYSERVAAVCRSAGMEYSRTVEETGEFRVPENFMFWNPTCHFYRADGELLEKFMRPLNYDRMRLMYIWGHSYEFYTEEKWQAAEKFFGRLTENENIWYATNIQIVDYMNAVRSLRFAEQCTSVYNPSCTDVWIAVDLEPVKIPAGATVCL